MESDVVKFAESAIGEGERTPNDDVSDTLQISHLTRALFTIGIDDERP